MDIVEQISHHINDLVLLGKKYSIETDIYPIHGRSEAIDTSCAYALKIGVRRYESA